MTAHRRYRDPRLVWPLVGAYAIHLVEEYAGGFPEWFALVAGRPLGRTVFLAINAVAFILMIAAARAAIRNASRGWLAIAIATLLFVNGVAHVLGKLATGSYSPGLVSSLILYVPLGLIALLRAWSLAPRPQFRRGVAAGLAIQLLVALLALTLANTWS